MREELLKTAKPILFNTEMVKAILNGKTVTRRVIKFPVNRFTKNVPVANDVSLEQIRPDKANFHEEPFFGFDVKLPYSVGDILYVRETWTELETVDSCPFYAYKADDEKVGISLHETFKRWHPSIHMPKNAARIFLKVKDVRVERLQEITEEQAEREGIRAYSKDGNLYKYAVTDDWWIKFHRKHRKLFIGSWWQDMPRTAKEAFSYLWNSTIKKSDLDTYGWNSNPWVWVVEFERIEVI